MKVFSKLLITILLIVFVSFFAWPISDEVSWSVTKTFWVDRASVDAGAAAVGSLFGVLLYSLLLVSCLWFFKKLWFPNKKDFDQSEEIDLPDLTKKNFRFEEQNGQLNALKRYTNNPEDKACPFCAEEVKYAAIKCKHCFSDISERKSI